MQLLYVFWPEEELYVGKNTLTHQPWLWDCKRYHRVA
jgi:hypothetical protein